MRGTSRRAWAADRLWFEVEGAHAERFLSAAGAAGVRLRHIRCIQSGYRACAGGGEAVLLKKLAEKGGWSFFIVSRRGPGCLWDRLTARPGLAVGAVFFLCLTQWFSSFVWAMDMRGLEADRQQQVRLALQQCGITEGSRVDEELLSQARQALTLRSEEFGWLSLNFTGGCLFVEQTEAEKRQIAPTPENTALYAARDAMVLSLDVKKGFPQVVAGQTVAAGQLLAAAVRLDRSGGPVYQAAEGAVWGQVNARYEARWPLEQAVEALSGRSADTVSLIIAGEEVPLQIPEQGYAKAESVLYLRPLMLGRLALPGCLCVDRQWEKKEMTLHYSEAAAKALARRACRKQLFEEFPDALIQTEKTEYSRENDVVVCRCSVTFKADIARQSEAPAELPQPEEN